jgi:hypothetical protein
VKPGAWQRIRNRNADIVGLRLAHHSDRCFDVGPFFAGIAELKKETRADTVTLQVFPCRKDLFHANAFIHGVENFLRSGFGAHPDFGATRGF